jgi:hypothetical protein
MKITAIILLSIIFISYAEAKESNYTASTPAAGIIRAFLGISMTDSIDFIRWKLSLTDLKYKLECNYGIGKPNTNGFYNGGKTVAFGGLVKWDMTTNTYLLQNGSRTIKLVELNSNLLHVLNNDNTLLIGGGGWSYALNNLAPSSTSQVKLKAKQTTFKDSIVFQGRTGCGVPNVNKSNQCYKLKWYLVLYNNNTYRVLGTGYRVEGGKKGNWKTTTGKDGRIVYDLNDENGKPFLHLLKLDEGILIFTDERGNLLVGDHDFSYTLNRKL